jgi:hypothetical protein
MKRILVICGESSSGIVNPKEKWKRFARKLHDLFDEIVLDQRGMIYIRPYLEFVFVQEGDTSRLYGITIHSAWYYNTAPTSIEFHDRLYPLFRETEPKIVLLSD